MSIVVGPHRFEYSEYDADHDILYLGLPDPPPGTGEETPEGHTVTFDDKGRVIGVDLFWPRRILQREGVIKITLPDGPTVVEGLEKLLKQPA